ncbi:MAG: hypothetical protein HY526_07670 [Betaproteobacteria bacterium]|nr:hypothetical protein [Betaproteobacteria bacterium]
MEALADRRKPDRFGHERPPQRSLRRPSPRSADQAATAGCYATWIVLALSLALSAGCASTPQASADRNAEAREFRSHPATAAIYVYRVDLGGAPDDSVLYLDHRLIGATLPGSFFRIDVRPGKHLLHGVAHDAGRLEIEVRPDEIYFVSLSVIGGHSLFALPDKARGRDELLACCDLLENWAPGQRPLLR